MSKLTINPDAHPVFWGHTIPSEISVEVSDDGYVLVSIESLQGETINGPGKVPDRDDPIYHLHLLNRGDRIDRSLHADEARALAAALVHFADRLDALR